MQQPLTFEKLKLALEQYFKEKLIAENEFLDLDEEEAEERLENFSLSNYCCFEFSEEERHKTPPASFLKMLKNLFGLTEEDLLYYASKAELASHEKLKTDCGFNVSNCPLEEKCECSDQRTKRVENRTVFNDFADTLKKVLDKDLTTLDKDVGDMLGKVEKALEQVPQVKILKDVLSEVLKTDKTEVKQKAQDLKSKAQDKAKEIIEKAQEKFPSFANATPIDPVFFDEIKFNLIEQLKVPSNWELKEALRVKHKTAPVSLYFKDVEGEKVFTLKIKDKVYVVTPTLISNYSDFIALENYFKAIQKFYSTSKAKQDAEEFNGWFH